MTNALSRETVDKADDIKCCVVPPPGLRNSFHDQFHRHILSRIQSHPICYNGELKNLTLIPLYDIDTLSNKRSQECMYIAPVDIESITTFNPCLNAVMTTCTGKESEMCIQKCNFGLWQHPGGKKCFNNASTYMCIDA